MRFKPEDPLRVEDCNCKTTPHFLNSARLAGKGDPRARIRTIRKSETQKVECFDPADRPASQREASLRNGLSARTLGSKLIRSFRLMLIVSACTGGLLFGSDPNVSGYSPYLNLRVFP
jgi:hypothetical protein